MDFWPSKVTDEIIKLNTNLGDLNTAMNKSSEASNSLQKRLVFWTKVMAGAIIVQVLVIVITTLMNI